MSDVISRFENFKTQINIYDGGTQIFFYPVANEYEFSVFSFWTEDENIVNVGDLKLGAITFYFGDKLIRGQDGFSLSR